jgi:uncharacterized protein YndB with AHSA1/START domain
MGLQYPFERSKTMSMTTNPPSVVDPDGFTVRRTITITASVEKVWAAITEAEHLARWFPHSAVLPSASIGTRGVFTWDDYGSFPVRVEEVDPPRSIAYRWSNSAPVSAPIDEVNEIELNADRSTVFRFTVEAIEGGTQLTVVETGFGTLANPSASMEDNRGGWNSELDELVAYLEGGS